MRARLMPVVVLALALLAALPAGASALRFRPCAGEIPGDCARVRVPLDRSGVTPGTVSLLVRRTTTGTRPSRRALLAIAGGPGQSAVAAFGESYFGVLSPLLDGRDFVALDVRGTGGSRPLRCPQLDRAPRDRRGAAGAACAARLGGRRSLYTTRDNVADIEAVRRALGVPQLTLFGVSYGTKLALAYAQAYPTHVERLLLDSVLLPEGPDALYRETFRGVRRVLPALCARRACRGITQDLLRDVARLAGRLRARPLRGPVVGADGRRRTGRVSEADLFNLVLDGDLLSLLRSELPSAVSAALRGDRAPLLRLVNPDLALGRRGALTSARPRAGPKRAGPVAFSEALFAATSCEEMGFPWSRTAPVSARPAAVAAALAAQPASAFAPFTTAVPPRTDFLDVCSRWPVRPAPPTLVSGPLPAVPALLLAGEDDIRTPLEQARIARSRLPRGRLLAVQAAGHGVTGGAVPRCVTRAIAAWAGNRPTPSRCRRPRPDPVTPVLPRRIGDMRPVRGVPGLRGRTLAAVVATLGDLGAVRQLFDRAGGLRGGWYRFADLGPLTLRRVSLVEGVTLTGVLRPGRRTAGTLALGGRAAARGRVEVRRDGRVTGTLAGRPIRTRLPAGLLRRVL